MNEEMLPFSYTQPIPTIIVGLHCKCLMVCVNALLLVFLLFLSLSFSFSLSLFEFLFKIFSIPLLKSIVCVYRWHIHLQAYECDSVLSCFFLFFLQWLLQQKKTTYRRANTNFARTMVTLHFNGNFCSIKYLDHVIGSKTFDNFWGLWSNREKNKGYRL